MLRVSNAKRGMFNSDDEAGEAGGSAFTFCRFPGNTTLPDQKNINQIYTKKLQIDVSFRERQLYKKHFQFKMR